MNYINMNVIFEESYKVFIFIFCSWSTHQAPNGSQHCGGREPGIPVGETHNCCQTFPQTCTANIIIKWLIFISIVAICSEIWSQNHSLKQFIKLTCKNSASMSTLFLTIYPVYFFNWYFTPYSILYHRSVLLDHSFI